MMTEVKLLVAAGARGRRDVLLDWDSDVVTRQVKKFGAQLLEVGLAGPRSRGLYVWEGSMEPRSGIFITPRGRTPRWDGSWRRATADEVARFAAGERLWQ